MSDVPTTEQMESMMSKLKYELIRCLTWFHIMDGLKVNQERNALKPHYVHMIT